MWILLSKPPAQVQGDPDSQHNDAMNWNATNTIEKRSFASKMQMKFKCAVYGACIKTPMSIYDSSSFALGDDINQYFHDMLTKIMTVANSF